MQCSGVLCIAVLAYGALYEVVKTRMCSCFHFLFLKGIPCPSALCATVHPATCNAFPLFPFPLLLQVCHEQHAAWH